MQGGVQGGSLLDSLFSFLEIPLFVVPQTQPDLVTAVGTDFIQEQRRLEEGAQIHPEDSSCTASQRDPPPLGVAKGALVWWLSLDANPASIRVRTEPPP